MGDRFKKVYDQGVLKGIEIWVDTETGVNYMAYINGYAGGLSPLLDREGKPIITPIAK
ncbi:MAG: xylan 1,4-beta-xylosidase [Lachnospiraceae bacterium]|nr:xylan 1,4-beta-xylosidase [Lachnospiraceae bacterium]